MKYIITESGLNQAIRYHLDSNFTPKDGWKSKEEYENRLKEYRQCLFNPEKSFYDFSLNRKKGIKTLFIWPWSEKELRSMFDDMWEPIFRDWFRHHTGMEFDHFQFMDFKK